MCMSLYELDQMQNVKIQVRPDKAWAGVCVGVGGLDSGLGSSTLRLISVALVSFISAVRVKIAYARLVPSLIFIISN